MTILSFISVFSAAFALSVGVVVLSQDSKNVLQRVFVVLSLAISYSAFVEFGFRQAVRSEDAWFWLNLGRVTPVIVPLIVWFVGEYTRSLRFATAKYVVVLLFLPALFFIGIDYATGSLSGQPLRTSWGWGQSVARSVEYHAYSVWSTLMLATAAILAVRYYLSLRNRRRRSQAKYVAAAISLVVFITIVIDTGVHYFNLQLPECATLGYAVANIIIAYAIRRHRLFVLTPVAASATIVETMSDALFLINPDGIIAHVNKAACELFGSSDREMLGRRLENFILTDAPVLKQLTEDTFSIDPPVSDVPAAARYAVADRAILLSVAGRSMRDTAGDIEGSVVTMRDITGRVTAEIALKESNDLLEERVALRTEELSRVNAQLADERERLAITLRSIGDGVITADEQGRITFLNRTAEQITGWTARNATGKPVYEVLKIFDGDAQSVRLDPAGTTLESGQKSELSVSARLVTFTGEEKRIDDSAAPIKNNDGEIVGVVVVFRDVTEKELMEEELFRAKRLESVALLAGGIAHDFNNLLTGINNNLFMCKMAVPKNTDVVTIVNEAERELLRAQQLAMQLLTFAQGGDPILEVCSPQTVIEESIGFLMSGSHCAYELHFGVDLMNFKTDRGMMEQVLSNLIVNAEQAMPDGGTVHLSADNLIVGTNRIDPEKRLPVHVEPGVYVRIGVSDTGIGIPDEIRDKVFDPFFSTKGKGRGMGLSIVQSIVQKHNGAVLIEPRADAGTSFLLYLPAVEQSAPEQVEPSQIRIPFSEEGGSGKILLMDDEASICRSTAKILEMAGYTVVTASNGEEAVARYRDSLQSNYPFDLVILDLTIPGGMGGRECMDHLRKMDPTVTAIVSSGYSTDDVMANYAAYGFRGVLRKPYSVENLYGCLRSMLG